jgi:polyphosphate glucokinase
MQGLFWPDVFILGGAISENFDEFAPLLRSSAEIRPARFTAQAGVIGAALAAAESLDKP